MSKEFYKEGREDRLIKEFPSFPWGRKGALKSAPFLP